MNFYANARCYDNLFNFIKLEKNVEMKTISLILFVFICSRGVQAEDENGIDQPKFDFYKKEVCKALPTEDNDPSRPFADQLTESEVLELALLNMAYNLNTDSVSFIKDKLEGWRKSVIDMISLITKTTCGGGAVVDEFANTAKNLYLYYLIKMNRGQTQNATEESVLEVWQDILQSLTHCAQETEPILLGSSCGLAVEFTGKDGMAHPIASEKEQFDVELENGSADLDVVIDTVWWMFSTTYARCYSYLYPNIDVMLHFLQTFTYDFLPEKITHRWKYVGHLDSQFSIIFGPIDYPVASENLRRCASAAYQYEGLAERQLVRPVSVVVNNVETRNFKLG